MKEKNSQKKILTIIFLAIIAILVVAVCIKLIPFITSLQDEATRIAFENYIDSIGIWGILLMIVIQILQVFIAFIPGEIVELVAGFLYGTWGGLAICLIGNVIGSLLIYLIVTTFAKQYMIKYKEKLKQYSFLNNKKKVAIYLFIIYLIPGIPKDIITYLAPFLPINFIAFIIVTSIARIPSIISSTYSSTSFLNNNYTIAIIMIIIFALLAVLGFIFKDKILLALKKDHEKEENSDNTPDNTSN